MSALIQKPIGRRDMLRRAAAALAVPMLGTSSVGAALAQELPRTGLGLVAYNCGFRRKWLGQQNPQFCSSRSRS
jgi:hypothetical protein